MNGKGRALEAGKFGGVRASWRRRGNERGSVLVEFALVIPIFAIMLFGMIQFGLVFAGWSSLRNSVQNGARMVAIGQLGSYPTGCLGLDPTYNDTATGNAYCTIVTEIGTPVGADISGTNPPVVDLVVGSETDSGVTSQVLTVCAQVHAQPLTGFFPDMSLSTTSELLIEVPAGVENYPSGITSCP